MSQVTKVTVSITSETAVAEACKTLKLETPQRGTTQFYDGTKHEGLIVKLQGWNYPIVVDTEKGEIYLDDFKGHWGEKAHYNKFIQRCRVEEFKEKAKKDNYYTIKEDEVGDSIKLTVDIQSY